MENSCGYWMDDWVCHARCYLERHVCRKCQYLSFCSTNTLSYRYHKVLHGMHRRHLRPWELFIEDDEVSSYELKKISLDTVFTSNSYEDEPWVVKYDKRNIIRKIFDRE